MEELKKQLEESNREAFYYEANKAFFYEECLKYLEKECTSFETRQEVFDLTKKIYQN